MPYGAQTKLGIARQASAGSWTIAANSYHALAFASTDIGLDKEELISENLIGRFEQGAVYDGIGNVNGTLEAEATPRNLLAIAGMVLNHSPAVVTSGTVRTWTFLPNTADFDATFVKAPFSIYRQFADSSSADVFFDCQGGQMELAFSQGQFARVRATIVGGARVPTGVASLNVVPDAADVGRLYPWNVVSISLGGSALQQMSDVTVTLNESVEPQYTMNGTLAPYKYSRSGFREVTVSGTLLFNDRAILNDFVAGTQRQLLLTATNTVASIQSGYFNVLRVDIPQLKITAFKPAVSGPGEVSVSFTGRGVIDPTSNYAMQVTLINSYASGI